MEYADMMVCPRCQGSTWDPDGGDCKVCGATGALTKEGKHVYYDEASDFIARLQDIRPRRFRI